MGEFEEQIILPINKIKGELIRRAIIASAILFGIFGTLNGYDFGNNLGYFGLALYLTGFNK